MGLGGRIFGTAAILGAGALAAAVVFAAPHIIPLARPAAREAVRRGLKLYERARYAAAEFVEDLEDLVAEAQSEITEKRAPDPKKNEAKQA